jgi:hypothetical protein
MTSCDFKTRKKDRKRTEHACCIRNTSICCPEAYYEPAFQKLLLENRRQNQWIFDLMSIPDCPGEKVFHDTPQWLLARDLHRGTDNRYLVVFKDTALRTIRDLRQHHLPLLHEINTRVRAWLRETQQGCFGMYFHFLPSVFQLHLHVRDKSFSRKHVRMQPLQNVMGNLAKTSMYYKDALIMTKYCKMFQKAETHRKMDINI